MIPVAALEPEADATAASVFAERSDALDGGRKMSRRRGLALQLRLVAQT